MLSFPRGCAGVKRHQPEIVIEGVVRDTFLDAVLPAHRLSIVGGDGHVYELEPTYLGAYLQRFVGRRVIVRAQVLVRGLGRSVVRLSSVTVHGDSRDSKGDANSGIIGAAPSGAVDGGPNEDVAGGVCA
jgi:hypothetical protein